ncbi:three component ABC system middle component [Streptomyces sp. NPDC090499]|uniref:three component ABC system middle component n=1 Tax=Streptomyces sp. NPDC090499 TaxID=3365965 RepID=UPI003819E226
MANWQQRPQAAAAFLNPALLATIQAASAAAYERESGGELMVWPLVTLTPPLVMHGPTRRALPTAVSTHLSSWVARNPVLVAGLPQRAASLAPVVQEGLRFGLRHGLLELQGGRVRGTLRGVSRLEGELGELVRKAQLVGRWTARTEQPSTVFALLGVRP